jgi:hypothetical protein
MFPFSCNLIVFVYEIKLVIEDCLLFRSSKKSSSSSSEDGTILHIDPSKCYGFIRSNKSGAKIYFNLRFVVNGSEEDVELYNGLPVKFDRSDFKDYSGKNIVFPVMFRPFKNT